MSALPHDCPDPLPPARCRPGRRPGRYLLNAEVIARARQYTTGQVAKICGVAPRTVSKWFDSGKLRGWRIPGSQDRRVPREELFKFLRTHGLTGVLAQLEAALRRYLLAVAVSDPAAERLRQALPEGATLDRVSDAFDLGRALALAETDAPPTAVLLDAGALGRGVTLGLLGQLARAALRPPPRLGVLVPDDGMCEEFTAAGAHLAVRGLLTADVLGELLGG